MDQTSSLLVGRGYIFISYKKFLGSIMNQNLLRPFKRCCSRILVSGHVETQVNGFYSRTPETQNGRVLYKQNSANKEESNFLYSKDSDYCVGGDPTIPCSTDRMISENQDCGSDIRESKFLNEKKKISHLFTHNLRFHLLSPRSYYISFDYERSFHCLCTWK